MNEPAEYARQVESYLCQKNRGHLIRVVGPAFELVQGWAATGVPLKVAFLGIDRCCARLEARGPRRRPIRVEFCEADVLEAFDEWRRAIGVGGAKGGDGESDGESAPRKPPLAAHIERVIARLAHRRGAVAGSGAFVSQIDQAIRDLESLVAAASRARGEARATIVGRLAELDAELMRHAVANLDEPTAGQLRREADAELAPFGARMPAEARTRAVESAFQRLVRDRSGLPTIGYE